MAYLPIQLTEQLYILLNISSPEKVMFPEVTHYFCFMRSTKGDNWMCSGKKCLKIMCFVKYNMSEFTPRRKTGLGPQTFQKWLRV